MCSYHSVLECCVMFSGVKLSMGSFVIFHYIFTICSPFVHYLFTICSCTFIVVSLYVHYILECHERQNSLFSFDIQYLMFTLIISF